MLAKLVLPSEDARLVSGRFCFRHHAFALIRARNRGPREHIVGVESQDAVRRFDRAVKILLSVVGLREAMQRVGKLGIEFERPLILLDRFGQLARAEKVDSCVVMFFRGGIRWGTHHTILASAQPRLVRAC
jgi:hypothetical protein